MKLEETLVFNKGMSLLLKILIAAVFGLWANTAFAWWDEGHMRIADMAYELLTPAGEGGSQLPDSAEFTVQ